MSVVSDLFVVADRIRAFLRKRDESDLSLFVGLIEPLHADIVVVIKDLLAMYCPISTSLMAIAGSPAQLPGNLGLDTTERIRQLVDEFVKRRKETRPARIAVDASACALLESYRQRDDDFAKNVLAYASLLRTIVGRSHIATTGKDDSRFLCSTSDGTTTSMKSLRDFLSEQASKGSLGLATVEIEEDEAMARSHSDIGNHCYGIAVGIQRTCDSIEESADQLTYCFARIKLMSSVRKS